MLVGGGCAPPNICARDLRDLTIAEMIRPRHEVAAILLALLPHARYILYIETTRLSLKA